MISSVISGGEGLQPPPPPITSKNIFTEGECLAQFNFQNVYITINFPILQSFYSVLTEISRYSITYLILKMHFWQNTLTKVAFIWLKIQ